MVPSLFRTCICSNMLRQVVFQNLSWISLGTFSILLMCDSLLRKITLTQYSLYHIFDWAIFVRPHSVIGCVTEYVNPSMLASPLEFSVTFCLYNFWFSLPEGSIPSPSMTSPLTLSAIPIHPDNPVDRIPPAVTQFLQYISESCRTVTDVGILVHLDNANCS